MEHIQRVEDGIRATRVERADPVEQGAVLIPLRGDPTWIKAPEPVRPANPIPFNLAVAIPPKESILDHALSPFKSIGLRVGLHAEEPGDRVGERHLITVIVLAFVLVPAEGSNRFGD